MPWRDTTDPYKIWLSEVILQQTRVAQGQPYYLRFVAKYPTVKALAKAPEQEVMRLWQGLGYYSRARNLHRCTKMVAEMYKGVFPTTYRELLTLPGIGSYTAAAIASFAFREPVPVVDGNVFRVLARIFGLETDIASPEAKKVFTEKAVELIDRKEPHLFNQAIMEFGAVCCTPKSPKCTTCPFQHQCVAFQTGKTALLPVKSKLVKVKKRYLYYFIYEWKGKVAMRKRENKDIWHGLYDFECVEMPRRTRPEKVFSEMAHVKIEGDTKIVGPVKHVLTHQLLTIWFCHIKLKESNKLDYYSRVAIQRLPKPIVITRHLQQMGLITKG